MSKKILPADQAGNVLMIPANEFKRGPWQPTDRDKEPIDKAMLASIGLHGVVDPILFIEDNKEKLIVSGHRRVHHAREALGDSTPIRAVQFTGTLTEAAALALILNTDRKNLSEGQLVRQLSLISNTFESAKAMCEATGLPLTTCGAARRLAKNLHPELHQNLATLDPRVPAAALLELAKYSTEMQAELLRDWGWINGEDKKFDADGVKWFIYNNVCPDEGETFEGEILRGVTHAMTNKLTTVGPALVPWDFEKFGQEIKLPICFSCPMNTANQGDLFEVQKGEHGQCMDSDCFRKKANVAAASTVHCLESHVDMVYTTMNGHQLAVIEDAIRKNEGLMKDAKECGWGRRVFRLTPKNTLLDDRNGTFKLLNAKPAKAQKNTVVFTCHDLMTKEPTGLYLVQKFETPAADAKKGSSPTAANSSDEDDGKPAKKAKPETLAERMVGLKLRRMTRVIDLILGDLYAVTGVKWKDHKIVVALPLPTDSYDLLHIAVRGVRLGLFNRLEPALSWNSRASEKEIHPSSLSTEAWKKLTDTSLLGGSEADEIKAEDLLKAMWQTMTPDLAHGLKTHKSIETLDDNRLVFALELVAKLGVDPIVYHTEAEKQIPVPKAWAKLK